MVVSPRAGEGSWAASPSCSAVERDRVQGARMEVENAEPPDGGDGPGLPSSQAAAVMASLNEGGDCRWMPTR